MDRQWFRPRVLYGFSVSVIILGLVCPNPIVRYLVGMLVLVSACALFRQICHTAWRDGKEATLATHE